MAYPIDNLGDYNTVRNALKSAGGKADVLFKEIGDNAVSQAAPKIFAKGAVTGIGIAAVLAGVYQICSYIKANKKAKENEQQLKQELQDISDALDEETEQTDGDLTTPHTYQ